MYNKRCYRNHSYKVAKQSRFVTTEPQSDGSRQHDDEESCHAVVVTITADRRKAIQGRRTER